MRVAFLGNAPWSVPSLQALVASKHDVVLAMTREPRPAGRGLSLTPTAVAATARGLGLTLFEVATVRSGPGLEALAGSDPDVLAVVAYGEILPLEVLEIPRVAPVNVHFSLLPRLRGAAPVQRALLEGDAVTGVTTIRMDQGMDTGPILVQMEEPIRSEDDAGALGARLAELGATALVETMDGTEAGTIQERPQDHAGATMAPKIQAGETIIDWSRDSGAVVRLVRALAPEPGASTRFRGRVLKILGAAAEPPVAEPDVRYGAWPAGAVVASSNAGPLVASGDGVVRLDVVVLAGRREMTGPEFVRGYRPLAGERLG